MANFDEWLDEYFPQDEQHGGVMLRSEEGELFRRESMADRDDFYEMFGDLVERAEDVESVSYEAFKKRAEEEGYEWEEYIEDMREIGALN